MNELRWILLVAGLLLLAGIYAWGVRSRRRSNQERQAEVRAPVFTGGATGFERPPAAAADEVETESERRLNVPAATRRIEPSVTLGDDDEAPDALGADDDAMAGDEPHAAASARREPTLTLRSEPAPRTPVATRPGPEPPVVEAPHAAAAEPRTAAPAGAGSAHAPEAAATAPKPAQRPQQKILAVRVSASAGGKLDGAELLQALQSEGLGFGRYDIFHRLHTDGRPILSAASLREPGSFDLAAMPSTTYPGVALFAVLPGPVPAAEAFEELIITARSLATQLQGVLADERGVPLTAHRVARLREDALEFGRAADAT